MKTETYTLPAFWASAIINTDLSGLSDEDEAILINWLSDVKPGYCLDVSQEPEFTKWHDAQDYVLACDCLEYTFQIVEA